MFITLSVHLICLQHVRRDAARRADLLATADPCISRMKHTRNDVTKKLAHTILGSLD